MRHPILISLLLAAALPAMAAADAGSTARLAILETTDLHANVLGYDYFKLQNDPSFGLDRLATLVAQARQAWPNTLLLDNGDAIQGNALADYQALVKPLACGERLAVYKALAHLGVEGGTLGNHEFDYGLPFLQQASGQGRCAGPGFPLVLANLVDAVTGQPVFAPYHLIDKPITVRTADGQQRQSSIRVGILGLTPPPVVSWDARWLAGKVKSLGMRETAERYVPEMRAKGAELVVVLSHSGLDTAPYQPEQENANLAVAKVAGIDALLMGHMHEVFPDAGSKLGAFNQAGVDKSAGRVHGVPAVMASLWGKRLGLIGLQLRHDGQRWTVDPSQTRVEVLGTRMPHGDYVARDESYARLIAPEHEATIAYVKAPLGSSDYRLSSMLADVGDPSAVAIVNLAQTEYVRNYIKTSLPQFAGLPVLSLSAPFKSGSAGPTDYTDVAAGPLAINNAADLYLYPNLLHAVKVDGAGLRAWLEKGAQRFNRIDPARKEAQELINPNVAGFDFDMATTSELQYTIDLTRAPGERILDLRYRGQPVNPAQEFIVATNSYRAGGGGQFPGLDGSKTVLRAPDASRDILIAYLQRVKDLHRAEHGGARSWRFAKVATAGPVLFRSAPGALALASAAGIGNVREVQAQDARGYTVYALDLSRD